MDLADILVLTVEDLKLKLGELGLDGDGAKTVLQERLIRHFGFDRKVEDVVSEYGEAASGAGQRSGVEHFGPSTFTLRDIDDTLSKFSGEGQPDISTWLNDFEDCAFTVGWNDLQKYVYARQLLTGAARIFCRSQNNIRDWASLKHALRKEFGVRFTAVEIHRMLKNRKKRSNESYREYLYCLMEIGSPINLDEESVIEYFIEGIPDSKANKTILYQATGIEDLKAKLKVYEKVTKPTQVVRSHGVRAGPDSLPNEKREESKVSSCFKCGEKGHVVRNCPKARPRCFKCNEVGHKSFNCKKNDIKKEEVKGSMSGAAMHTLSGGQEEKPHNTASLRSNRIFKDVTILGFEVSALVDTGSDISCVRYDSLMLMNDVTVSAERRKMVGIGEKEIETIGSFEANVCLDGVEVPIKFHVARERDILYSAVLGNDVLEYVEVLINADGAKFSPKSSKPEAQRSNESSNIKTVAVSNDDLVDDDFNKATKELAEICVAVDPCEIDVSHLKREFREDIMATVRRYQPVKPKTFPVKMKILLKDEIPVVHNPRRMSYEDQKTVDNQISEWLREGIVQPSCSEYSSPIVLVSKKDGGKRLCCDYRRLNEKIIRDNFPMAIIDDTLQRLQEAKVYTTLDLQNGFFHVPIEEDSRRYTAFVTHRGQFEFSYVPFGITNSPAVFCRYISAIFHALIMDGTIVIYMDDMVIPSVDEKEGLEKLNKVLKVAESNGLRIKWSKCQFLKRRITFLGYVIENSTILPSKEKTVAVEKFPIPKDRKAVQRFLGLTSYFRRFIPNYALVAKPLSDLLKKNANFKMGDEEMLAVQQLKAALVGASVLRLFNPNASTEIHTDASKHGYGAVLLQMDSEDGQLHPVQFMSRKTTPFEEKYHSYELEVLAIIEALKKWRVYLLGIKFRIVTDCNAFAMTMKKRDVPLRVSRWALFLQDFNYVIEHRSGNKMRHVDALSRASCLMMEDSLRHRIKESQQQDDWIKVIGKILETQSYEDFYLKHGIVHKDPTKELVVIPLNMEREIIELAHKQGHFAAKKTAELVARTFYIRNLNAKAERVTKDCIECIMAETKRGKREGLLTPIDKADKPLMTYHLDHVGPMETTKKQYNHILVVVDAFSKFVWLYPTKSTGTTEVVERLRKQAAVFGNPVRLITDRGTAFTSNEFGDYCKEEGIQHLMIATGVPRGNGQVERIHQIIIPLLTKLCLQSPPQNWYRYVDMVQQTINSTPSRSTGSTPFEILTGLRMRIKEDRNIQNLLDEELIQELHHERNAIRERARESILKIQRENKGTFDKGRDQERKYEPGELVAIKRTQFGSGLKLRPKYLGPYKIIKVSNHGRYEVEKIGEGEGSRRCTTVAEHMKPWSSAFGPNATSGGPNVGSAAKGLRRSTRQNKHND